MNSFGGTHSPATSRRKIRRRRGGCCGRRGAPSTPQLHWTFYNNNDDEKKKHHPSASAGAGGRHVELSARKLAAGLWQLRLSSAESPRCKNGGFASKRRSSYGFRLGMAHVNMMLSQNQTSKEHGSDTRHHSRRRQSTASGPKQGTLYNLESAFPHSKSVTEGATKWDSRCSKTSIEAYCFLSHMKLLEDQVKTVSFVSALQAKLVQAQLYIHDLESEVRSSRKKVKYLLRKLGEERISQKKELHDNIYALIDDLKGQLSRERKSRQRMEILNSQLFKELDEAKLSATKLIRKYEEEKRTRVVMEEVCNQLAKKIGEDKAELEALRTETMKIREEMEEERKMLQLAEIWREERVQMKLSDAKLALESKYSQMNKLITVLENFLRSRGASLDVTELRTAEVIGKAVISVSNIQDIGKFSYEPFRLRDIFSNFEGRHQFVVCEREIEPCFNYYSAGAVSNYHPVSPEINDHDNEYVKKLSSGLVDYNSGMEEDSRGGERVNHAENQGSSYSVEEIINAVGKCKNAPRCEIESDENAGGDTPNTDTSEVCSLSAKRSKRKKSSAKLQKSCASSNGFYKAISHNGNGRLSSGTISSLGTIFPNRKAVKGGIGHQNSMGQWGADLVNPHIARGMKGSIEWPRGFQKHTLKAKLLEARIAREKAQLRRHSIG